MPALASANGQVGNVGLLDQRFVTRRVCVVCVAVAVAAVVAVAVAVAACGVCTRRGFVDKRAGLTWYRAAWACNGCKRTSKHSVATRPGSPSLARVVRGVVVVSPQRLHALTRCLCAHLSWRLQRVLPLGFPWQQGCVQLQPPTRRVHAAHPACLTVTVWCCLLVRPRPVPSRHHGVRYLRIARLLRPAHRCVRVQRSRRGVGQVQRQRWCVCVPHPCSPGLCAGIDLCVCACVRVCVLCRVPVPVPVCLSMCVCVCLCFCVSVCGCYQRTSSHASAR